jgi:hypothetical protein
LTYLNRTRVRRSAGSPELLSLLIVLVAGVAAAWWISGRIGMDLSSLKAAPAILGLNPTTRPLSGFDGRVSTIEAASAAAGVADAPAEAAAVPVEAQATSPAAPFCRPGQTPEFVHGLAELKRLLGDPMGTPIECEHPANAGGDTMQQTTTGLAAYYRASNAVTFTNGWEHWALTPDGLIFWEGTQSEPPPVSR